MALRLEVVWLEGEIIGGKCWNRKTQTPASQPGIHSFEEQSFQVNGPQQFNFYLSVRNMKKCAVEDFKAIKI